MQDNLRSIHGHRNVSAEPECDTILIKLDAALKMRDEGNSGPYESLLIVVSRLMPTVLATVTAHDQNAVTKAKIKHRSGQKVVYNAWDGLNDSGAQESLKKAVKCTVSRGRGRPAGSTNAESLTGKIRNLVRNGEGGITQAKLAIKVGKQPSEITITINNGKNAKNKWCRTEGCGITRKVYPV